MALLADNIGSFSVGQIRGFFDGLKSQPTAGEKSQPKAL
jgi:hypothetical protein